MKPYNELTKPKLTLNPLLFVLQKIIHPNRLRKNNVNIVTAVFYTELLYLLRKMEFCLLGAIASILPDDKFQEQFELLEIVNEIKIIKASF